jgi:aspartokinase/homoserine dehydrogenase 1
MKSLPNQDSWPLNSAHSSCEPTGRHSTATAGGSRINVRTPDRPVRGCDHFTDLFPQRRAVHAQARKNTNRQLRVMKFGGTSVGDASCIARVVEIISLASRNSDLVVVVSAMSGVTNKLIEAAMLCEAGNQLEADKIFEGLERQHELAAKALIHSPIENVRVLHEMRAILQEGRVLCQATCMSRELSLRVRDAISSLGERLSAPLVAAALICHGVPSEAIEATEVVVTNSCFGGAEPHMDRTRERCEERLRPILRRSVIPVVTGFIGATGDGDLTTLGRGGSDYSATILAAALRANEVIIWTDVDGVLTSDPRLVPGACTIPEISYHEAAELAHFGAKVLHPKTLRPLLQSEIPVWIRNTFAPEKLGTKVTPEGSSNNGEVKALTAVSDAALIKVGGPAMADVPNVLARTFRAIAAARAEVLLVLQASSQNHVRLVIPSAIANHAVETLRREFAQDLTDEAAAHIALDSTIGIVTIVGQHMRQVSAVIGRTFCALDREKVRIIAVAQGSSECNVSFVVERKDVTAALICTHREFKLGVLDPVEHS